MKSNSFVCSFCRTEDALNLYFLPCLNIVCNQCVASHLSGVSNHSKKLLDGSYVIVKELEAKVNFEKDDERSLYSLARDDGSYETIRMEGLTNGKLIKNYGSSEGYEVPNNHSYYENPIKSFLKYNMSQESPCNNDEGCYEQVTSKNNKMKEINSDDEMFDEVHTIHNRLSSARQNDPNVFPPLPSFRRKSATFPGPQNNSIPIKTDHTPLSPKCNEHRDQESLFATDDCEVMKDSDDMSISFKCPFCQDLHWISECGELFMPFPAPPRCSSFTSHDKVKRIIKLLKNIPTNCNSKVCVNPCKNGCCFTCGKVSCSNCLLLYHPTHHSSDFKQLSNRYASLVKSYHDSNEEQKQICLSEMKKLETARANLNSNRIKTIELLSRQKELLISEIDKIFKDKVDSLERNIGIEMSQLENSLAQITNVVVKLNQFIDFSKAYLSRDDKFSGRMDIFYCLINSHPCLAQYKLPEPKDAVKVYTQLKELDNDALSLMIGDVYFKKNPHNAVNTGSMLQENEVPKLEKVDAGELPYKASTKMGNTKARSSRMSKIFRRSGLPSRSEAVSSDQSTDKDHHCAPSANFNLQLTSDQEDCRLINFSVYDGHHIITVDSNNRCFKILDLANDSLKVVPLEEDATLSLNVVIVDKDEEFVFATARNGSNCIKLHSNDGKYTIGESYLLRISSLACNSSKQILASDVVHRKIFVHDSSGRLLFSFPRGSRHGKMKSPQNFIPLDMKINPLNDDVVVLDETRGSFLIFDRVGIYLFHLPGDINSLCDNNNIAFNVNDKDAMLHNNNSRSSSPGSKRHNSQSNGSDIIFDEEGSIYQRSRITDELIVYDCNGKYLRKVCVDIPNFGSCSLISVMDCLIRRSISGEENLVSERSILLSTNPTTISVYKLNVPCEELKPRLEQLDGSVKEVDKDDSMSLEIIESRYADMTGRMRNENPITRPSKKPHGPPEHVYSTIVDEDKHEGGDPPIKSDTSFGTLEDKSKRRFSARFKKIFKRSSNIQTAD